MSIWFYLWVGSMTGIVATLALQGRYGLLMAAWIIGVFLMIVGIGVTEERK